MMVFADKRYGRSDKLTKLPIWIREHLRDSHMNLSLDMMLCIAKTFMLKMGQPFPLKERERSLLTEKQVLQLAQKEDAMEIDAM